MYLTATDRRLLTALQGRFPIALRPFAVLGAEVGYTEGEVVDRVWTYKREKLLREIHGVFDSRALGYRSVLVAAHVEKRRLQEAAMTISRDPGVSHNYGRTHWFNLWFTLAVGPDENLEATVDHLARDAGLEQVRLLPMVRQFKIGVAFDLENFSQSSSLEEGTAQALPPGGPACLSERDIALIRALQEDLPVCPRPFEPASSALGMREEQLLEAVGDLKRRGILRRFGALLMHREAGFRANAMVCWKVSPERAETVGNALAAFRAVSHCYQRPTYPDWPYSHFTMLHARKRTECQAMADEIARSVHVEDYLLLMSSREFKKESVRYFADRPPAPAATAVEGV